MVKAEVCKTSTHRFDSGRRLQIPRTWFLWENICTVVVHTSNPIKLDTYRLVPYDRSSPKYVDGGWLQKLNCRSLAPQKARE